MAIGFKHGSFSGGSPLGLFVVSGNSRPSSPRENTVWVNSDNAVTAWVVSFNEPDGESGKFWVKTDQYSAVFMTVPNGKNIIIVQPVTAYEYTSEGWAVRSAEVYQNGEWKALEDLTGYYFKDGNQCSDVTGGWTTEGWSNYGTVTVGSAIVLSAETGQYARVGTAKAVDLTNVNKIWYDSPNGTNGKSYGGYLCVKNTKDLPGNPSRSVSIKTAGTGNLDVSTLSGDYYIYLVANGSSPSYLDFRAIWME